MASENVPTNDGYLQIKTEGTATNHTEWPQRVGVGKSDFFFFLHTLLAKKKLKNRTV